MDLVNGANAALIDPDATDSLDTVRITVQWVGADDIDVDLAALLVAGTGQVRSDEDFVFYNQPDAESGAVRLLGKNHGDTDSSDRLLVALADLPGDVHRVVVVASLDAPGGVGFAAVPELSVQVQTVDERPVLRFRPTGLETETTVVLGELYRRESEWKFRAVGQGYAAGLAGLASDYGINVEEEAAGDHADEDAIDGVDGEPGFRALADEIDTDDPDTAGLDPADLARDVEAVPPTDVEPASAPNGEAIADDSSWVDGAGKGPFDGGTDDGSVLAPVVTLSLAGSAPASRRARTSTLRTKRTKAKPAPVRTLTHAEDGTWHAARLFPVVGIGGADEQERRATSATLSVMMSVREFGRAVTARLGAPAGVVETYLEVPFKLAERTVIPDAVVRVARGGRMWTALVEVKTGSSPLVRDQVEAYLDVARERGYDVVLTISNEIAPAPGEHPVGVDRRKLRKVSLQHLSWAEIRHEATMQLQHRGVEDPTQAWILAELVRYLRHPRTGTGGFEDMGASWVPVREAVVAATLRPGDRHAAHVVRSWERLTRWLALRMTAELGVEVAPVVPRRLAADTTVRLAQEVGELAGRGTLAATLRIPGAVGTLNVVADVRRGLVETSVEMEAPNIGREATRVNWLLRQLADSPDGLRVEVFTTRRGETLCELLRDARKDPKLLVPADPGSEVRRFRLTATAPLGPKRGLGRGGFITSVNVAVDGFYRDVVQHLRAWAAPAPQMPDGQSVELSSAAEADAEVEAQDTAATEGTA